jgi:hypothetical protein
MQIILGGRKVDTPKPNQVLTWDSGSQELHSYIIIDPNNKMRRIFPVGQWVCVNARGISNE